MYWVPPAGYLCNYRVLKNTPCSSLWSMKLLNKDMYVNFHILTCKVHLLKLNFCSGLWAASSPVGATEDPSAEELSGIYGSGRTVYDFPRPSAPIQSTIISGLCDLSHCGAGTFSQTALYHRSVSGFDAPNNLSTKQLSFRTLPKNILYGKEHLY